MMFKEIPIVVVLGHPCAGKTTLSKKLADLLEADHISIGDLIREARDASSLVKKMTENAFQGNETFSVEWLSKELAKKIYADQPSYLVIDAGPPIHLVAKYLGLKIECVFLLQTSDELCYQRFQLRKTSQERTDDQEEIFHRRFTFYQMELKNVIKFFKEETLVHELDGNCSVLFCLRQALSCLLIRKTMQLSSECRQNENLVALNSIDFLQEPFTAINHSTLIRISPPKTRYHFTPNHLVMLFKPKLIYSDRTLLQINKKLSHLGYHIEHIKIWPGREIKKNRVAQAHFDCQYLSARWGDKVATIENSTNLIVKSSYKYLHYHGQKKLAHFWQQGKNPIKQQHFVWLKEDQKNSYLVLNGHIPLSILDYEEQNNQVIAVHLRQIKKKAASWWFLRKHFLGSSDPRQAPKYSLRGLAYEGKLDIKGDISLHNNAFHLSAGPYEAFRELITWFGFEIAIEAYQSIPDFDWPNYIYDRKFGENLTLHQETEEKNLTDVVGG